MAIDSLCSGSITVYQPVTVARGEFCAKHWQTNLTAMSCDRHVCHPIIWDTTWERTNQIAPLSQCVPSAHMRPPTKEKSSCELFWCCLCSLTILNIEGKNWFRLPNSVFYVKHIAALCFNCLSVSFLGMSMRLLISLRSFP